MGLPQISCRNFVRQLQGGTFHNTIDVNRGKISSANTAKLNLKREQISTATCANQFHKVLNSNGDNVNAARTETNLLITTDGSEMTRHQARGFDDGSERNYFMLGSRGTGEPFGSQFPMYKFNGFPSTSRFLTDTWGIYKDLDDNKCYIVINDGGSIKSTLIN